MLARGKDAPHHAATDLAGVQTHDARCHSRAPSLPEVSLHRVRAAAQVRRIRRSAKRLGKHFGKLAAHSAPLAKRTSARRAADREFRLGAGSGRIAAPTDLAACSVTVCVDVLPSPRENCGRSPPQGIF